MARRFNGTSDWLNPNVSCDCAENTGLVFGCLLKSDIEYATDGAWAGLIYVANDANRIAGIAIGYEGSIGSANKGFAFIKSSTAAYSSFDTVIDDGEWHSVIGGRKANGNTFSCVDGGSVITGTTQAGTLNISARNFYFGAQNNQGAAARFFDGILCNLFISDGSDLSDSKIQELSEILLSRWMTSNDLSVSDGGIWNFDGDSLEDVSGLGNDATIGSGTTVEDDPFRIVAKQFVVRDESSRLAVILQ